MREDTYEQRNAKSFHYTRENRLRVRRFSVMPVLDDDYVAAAFLLHRHIWSDSKSRRNNVFCIKGIWTRFLM